jgi:hypothetical protein
MKVGDVVRIRKPGRPKMGVVTLETDPGHYEVTFKDLSKMNFPISQLVLVELPKKE